MDEEKRRVEVGISPFNAPIVMRLLLEVGAYPMASSSEPAQFTVSVEDAARIPLFRPMTSRKLDRVVSLARV